MGKFQFFGVLSLFLVFSLNAQPVLASEQSSRQKKQACEEAEKKAQTACNDSAPQAQQAQQQQNQQAQNKGGSTQGDCSNRAAALAPLLGMLGGLQSGCQAAQADCEAKCGQAKQSPGTDCAGDPSCMPTGQDTAKTGNEKGGKCKQLDKNLEKIASEIAKAMANLAAAQKCQEDTNKDCKNPEFAAQNPQQCQPEVNCNKPETYATKPEEAKKCRCLQNPRGADCAGFQAADDANPDAARKGPKETALTSAGETKPAAGALIGNPSAPSGPQTGGLGGGSSGGGRQGSSEKGGSARDGIPGKNDAIQVNAGEYGGSGGGAKPSGGFPDSANSAARGPAGKKILTRNEMSFIKGTATGANGRSNWQKIRDRYRDNHPTFTP